MNAVNVTPDAAVVSQPISRRVARNSVLYFLSLAVPALAALFLVPVTVRALGPSRFGLLALAWAVAESTGVFDFGMGKATIRFVADATEKGTERVKEIVLSSAFTQTGMGLLAGAVFFVLTPFLVSHVFSIAQANVAEAMGMFRVLALHMPVLLALSSLRASLEGAQRFDISTALRIPGSLASVAVPAFAAFAGCSLATIMWILLAIRVVLALLTAYAVRRTLLPNRWMLPSHLATLREMLGYSGWVAVSTTLGPILGSFDRFVVGSVIGGAGLGYYGGASEAANRFLLIPVTAFSAMLPALAATDAREGSERSLAVTHAARRQLAALMFPLCLVLFVFGPAILGVWLGRPFAEAAGMALRVLSVGVFLAGLAMLPLALLYGAGRPDLPAKINVLQVVVHIPLTIVLVHKWGLTGAATAMAIRCAEDLVGYEWASRRAVGHRPPAATGRKRDATLLRAALVISLAFVVAVWVESASPAGAVAVVAIALALYTWWCWTSVLSEGERCAWVGVISPSRSSDT